MHAWLYMYACVLNHYVIVAMHARSSYILYTFRSKISIAILYT